MNRFILVILATCIWCMLAGCWDVQINNYYPTVKYEMWDDAVESLERFKEELIKSENVLDTNIEETMTCIDAIQQYLSWADKNWEWVEIKAWDNIVVDYIGRLDDGTVFDTSIESIAKACGSYTDARDYTAGLPFEVWAGQMIKWFDEWVIGMKLWQTKTVKFGPEKWYGERNEDLVMTYSAEEIWDLSQYQEWMTVYLGMWMPAKITKVTDKELTIDLNHELAGKSLIFDITIKQIN
mgnify:CR=1 FL=1